MTTEELIKLLQGHVTRHGNSQVVVAYDDGAPNSAIGRYKYSSGQVRAFPVEEQGVVVIGAD